MSSIFNFFSFLYTKQPILTEQSETQSFFVTITNSPHPPPPPKYDIPYTGSLFPVPNTFREPFRTPQGLFLYETCLGGHSVHQRGFSCTKHITRTISYTTRAAPVRNIKKRLKRDFPGTKKASFCSRDSAYPPLPNEAHLVVASHEHTFSLHFADPQLFR